MSDLPEHLWDWDAILAAALARCEALGVGLSWQTCYTAQQPQIRQVMWGKLSNDQKQALCDYWLWNPEID